MPIPWRSWKSRCSQRFPGWKWTSSRRCRYCSGGAGRGLPRVPICCYAIRLWCLWSNSFAFVLSVILSRYAADKTKKRRTSRPLSAQTVGFTTILPVVNSTDSVSRIANLLLSYPIWKVNPFFCEKATVFSWFCRMMQKNLQNCCCVWPDLWYNKSVR